MCHKSSFYEHYTYIAALEEREKLARVGKFKCFQPHERFCSTKRYLTYTRTYIDTIGKHIAQ